MTFDLDIWQAGSSRHYLYRSCWHVSVTVKVQGYNWKIFLFGYGRTLRGDVYILNRQTAAPNVHTTPLLVGCRVLRAKVVGVPPVRIFWLLLMCGETHRYGIFVEPDPDTGALVAAFDVVAGYSGSSVVLRCAPLQRDVVDVAVADHWRSR